MEWLEHIVRHENISISEIALTMVARKGDGSMRDSLSTLDQVLAFCGDNVLDEDVTSLLGVVDRRLLLETSASVFARDPAGVLEAVQQVDAFGYSMRQFCQELIEQYRVLAILKAVKQPGELIDLADAELALLKEQAAPLTLDDLQRQISLLIRAESEMAPSSFPRLVLEMALVRAATLPPVIPIGDILERLKGLERKLTSGDLVAGQSPRWEKSAPAPRRPLPRLSGGAASHRTGHGTGSAGSSFFAGAGPCRDHSGTGYGPLGQLCGARQGEEGAARGVPGARSPAHCLRLEGGGRVRRRLLLPQQPLGARIPHHAHGTGPRAFRRDPGDQARQAHRNRRRAPPVGA